MDFKYEVKEIQEEILKKIDEEVHEGLDHVCTKELGEAIDMIKDLAEVLYYYTVVEAMNKEDSSVTLKKDIMSHIPSEHITTTIA